MSSFRKLWGLGQLKHSFHSLQTESLELRGIGLLCFFCGIKESIEILVHPSFCLSPSHMVLSLMSYFSPSLFKKMSFSGGQNWPFKQSSFLASKEISQSQKSLKRKFVHPAYGKPRDFSEYLLPSSLVLLLDVFWCSIVRCWIHFTILLSSSPELPLPRTSTHY